ncbi:hypothetical protein QBC38DRAFT_430364 [Podospora fimiseda]|uniref:Uncharacterized protein n=1 Tax=Podospora fimiseda TaxID=252190 RepID=A0AAN7BCF4_9PEZI|nr:hypothetical protein QBC38DRAFT_430364 [Podospora fimiseda]
MALSNSASSTPAWEQKLRLHVQLSVAAIKTGSVHSLQAFETAHYTATLLASTDTDNIPSDVTAKIGSIQTGTVQDVQTSATQCTDSVEKLKGTTPDQQAWIAKINSANETAIKNFADKVNAAGSSAINYIKALPPKEQNGAANVYSGGMAIVNTAINAVSGFLSNIVGQVKDFLAGIWNKITSIGKSILDTCTSAARSLASFFGFGFKMADFVPGANVAAGEVKSYTGKVMWDLSVGRTVARAQLGDIIDQLTADRTVGVASEQLAIEEVGGKGQVIVGSVKFGAQSAVVRRGISDVQDLGWLGALFEKIVRASTQGVVLESERASLLDLNPSPPLPQPISKLDEAAKRRKDSIMRDLEKVGLHPSDN